VPHMSRTEHRAPALIDPDLAPRLAVAAELRDLAANLTGWCDPTGTTTGDLIQEMLLNRAEEVEAEVAAEDRSPRHPDPMASWLPAAGHHIHLVPGARGHDHDGHGFHWHLGGPAFVTDPPGATL